MYLKPEDKIERAALFREAVDGADLTDNGILMLAVAYTVKDAAGLPRWINDVVRVEYQWSNATWFKTRIVQRDVPGTAADVMMNLAELMRSTPHELMDGTVLHHQLYPFGQWMRDDLPWELLPKATPNSRILFQRSWGTTGKFELAHGMYQGYDPEENTVSILAKDQWDDRTHKERAIAPGDVVCIIP